MWGLGIYFLRVLRFDEEGVEFERMKAKFKLEKN